MTQSEFVYKYFNYKPGFFVDVGAYDGYTGSNTYLLEKHGWTGACIEPNIIPYEKLVIMRNCRCYNLALSDTDCIKEFNQVTGYAEQLSYIDGPEEHSKRVINEINKHGGQVKKINIECKRLDSIISRSIDYLSIDAENHELSILKGINFDKNEIL